MPFTGTKNCPRAEQFMEMTSPIVSNNLLIRSIDFGKLGPKFPDGEDVGDEWKKLSREVSEAFSNIGFVYINNHGIPQNVIDGAHEVGAKFFSLPDDQKSKYSKTDVLGQGFVEMNREKLDKEGCFEVRESYDVRNINGTFPVEVTGFQNAMGELIRHAKLVACKLLRCLEISLDIPKGTFLSACKTPFSPKNGSLLRVLYYPAILNDIKEGAIRCGAHTDYGFFTLLFQDNMGGLEVLTPNGQWIKADPLPGQILVNIGDLLEIWTAGKFKATEHRVLVPLDEMKQKCPRRSIVMFFHPDDDTIIQPLNSALTTSPITAGEHLLKRYKETYKF